MGDSSVKLIERLIQFTAPSAGRGRPGRTVHAWRVRRAWGSRR
jgi:hypothetical protein